MTMEAVQDLLASAVRATDINHTVDFERAQAVLDGIAGRLFTQYRAAMLTGTPGAVEQAKAAYIEAHARTRALRPTDHDAIRKVLGE